MDFGLCNVIVVVHLGHGIFSSSGGTLIFVQTSFWEDHVLSSQIEEHQKKNVAPLS